MRSVAIVGFIASSLAAFSPHGDATESVGKMAAAGNLCVATQAIGGVVVVGIWQENGVWYVQYINPPHPSTTTRPVTPYTREMGAQGGVRPGWIRFYWHDC